MHVKVTNGVPEIYTIGQLRRDNPNTSFPKNIPAETLATYGVYPLAPTNRPVAGHTKNVEEGTPQQIGGVWTQVWEVTDASAAEIEIRVRDKARHARSQRDSMLQTTDWLVIKAQETNGSISVEWAAYRQALRDITAHANFPYLEEADWPVKPE